VHKTPGTLVTVDESNKAPLGEEVANCVLVVPLTDASNEDLTGIGLTQETCLVLCLFRILPPWRGKSHGQLPRSSGEVLRVYDCAVSVSCKLESNECIQRLFRFALLGWNHTDALHMAVPSKVSAH